MRCLPFLLLVAIQAVAPSQQVTLSKTLVASGLSRPVEILSTRDDPTRLYVLEQGNSSTIQAQVRLILNGVLQATPFLNIDSLVSNSGNERGLLGMAFHPNYASNGFFFVHYSANNSTGDTRVARYTRSAANPNVADPTSAQIIYAASQPYSNHNGGSLHFGPDGYLYLALGDGGSANDPGNRAQTLSSPLGKIHRFDVDNIPVGATFGVPPTNPLIGVSNALPEIWHYGLRNPWKFSFDRLTGDMYIADVGQNAREEINRVPAGVGGLNFGWRCMEANQCTGLSGCTCNAATLTLPIHFYLQGSSTGFSITGGYVYRGSAICGFQGHYIFADYVTNKIWSFKYQNGSVGTVTDRTAQLSSGLAGVASFGEDALGELYIASRDGGTIHRINGTSTGTAMALIGAPTIGTSPNLLISATTGANKGYLCALSLGTAPGIPLLDGRNIPLNFDSLLQWSVTPGNPLLNGAGTFPLIPNAQIPLNIPFFPPLVGATVYASFVVLEPSNPTGVGDIHCTPLAITFQ
jgi:glucose/arabinose dehydrogenase